MCPHCGSQAPIVYRGLAAYCTACGRPRVPLSDKSVSHAGRGSKVGGHVAGVLGWVMLVGGLSMALLLGLLAVAIFPGSIAGWVVGLPIALLALGVGLPLLIGGRNLEKSGAAAERRTRIEALFSLAANRGGTVTARDAGAALDIPADQADALLTDLAKERPDDVTVEVSDRGEILYAFPGVIGQTRSRVRVDAGGEVGWRVADAGAGEAEREAAEEESAEGSPARQKRSR